MVRMLALITLVFSLPVAPCASQVESDLPEKAPDEPDHLVPLDPYAVLWNLDYTNILRKKLELPFPGEEAAVMVFRPSFEGEECLVIHESGVEHPAFTLIHTRTGQNIWYSMPENNEDGKQKRVVVTRREAPLPPDLGERVCHVWDRMLRGVRYPIPDEEPGGSDGVTIEFWRYQMYGRAWSPSGGAPKGFVDLGRSLIDYCEAPEEKRAAALKEIERRCQSLERYFEKHHSA